MLARGFGHGKALALVSMYGLTSGSSSCRMAMRPMCKEVTTSCTASTVLPGVADRASTRKNGLTDIIWRTAVTYAYAPVALWASSAANEVKGDGLGRENMRTKHDEDDVAWIATVVGEIVHESLRGNVKDAHVLPLTARSSAMRCD